MTPLPPILLLIPLLLLTPTTSTTITPDQLTSICQSTPHPQLCMDTMKLSISITTNSPILNFILHSLGAAISSATNLTSLLPTTTSSSTILEKQKGSVQDCRDLHRITLSSLEKSRDIFRSTADGEKMDTVRAHLSAALTNKNTCLQGLSTAAGPMKEDLMEWIAEAYKHVGNSLAVVTKSMPGKKKKAGNGRRLMGRFPAWMSQRDRRILDGDYDEDGGDGDALTLVVASDGSGNFTTISDAIAFAPNNSPVRTFIEVRAGVYEENVEIGMDKTNIVLLGDGSDVTVITGSRSAGDGWTTFSSATVAVSGEGFLARDITFENTAGAAKGQAAALRINADLAAIYRCSITGHQDTLYVHSFRQFYREVNVTGTVDFILGNAAAIFQSSNLIATVPLYGQSNVVTAQSKDDPNEATGIVIHRCNVIPSAELAANPQSAKTYLGRPWEEYATTVYMGSYLGELVEPAGWLEWDGERGLDTLYYGEYENVGPGAGLEKRVGWEGFHVMGYDEAVGFTVSEFIQGDQWLQSTSFPYDDGV